MSDALTNVTRSRESLDAALQALPIDAPESGYGHWLTVIGAWFAAWFVILFLGELSGRLLQSNLFCAVLGALALVVGVGASRLQADEASAANRSELAAQFLNIACVLGSLLVGIALGLTWRGISWVPYALAAVVAGICLYLSRRDLQQQWFAVLMLGSLCAGLVQERWTSAAWSLCMVGIVWLTFTQRSWVVKNRGGVFNAHALALILGALILPMIWRNEMGFMRPGADATNSDLIWAGLGLLSAACTATVSLRTGLTLLRWLALAAVFVYGFLFYFSIGSTLLDKAYALLVTGAALLVARYCLVIVQQRRSV
jgi:hypothetical protein